MRLSASVLASIVAACLYLPTPADAFASWFVDRRVSCMTDLAPGEIIMNNGVLPHSSSRESGIRLEVTPLGKNDSAEPNSEYVVKFAIPKDARARLPDVQFVMELGGGGGGSSLDGAEPPARFTTAAPGGGIGCEGRRSHATARNEDSAAIFTVNEDAARGARLEIIAGWATGHEAVTLTEKAVVIVGKGVEKRGGGGGGVASGGAAAAATDDALHVHDGVGEGAEKSGGGGFAFDKAAAATRDDDLDAMDDALMDDIAEAEMEETFLEEERKELENEIESAEEDAVEALEEKRIETNGMGAAINEAEEEVVEALEEGRKNVEQKLDSLKDEIVAEQAERQRANAQKRIEHDLAQRREAQRKHREQHNVHRNAEDNLEEMRRRFEKGARDARRDKLDELMGARAALGDSVQRLKRTDRKEHERARHEHIKRLPRQELKVDLEEIKQHAKEKIQHLSDKLGVNELLNDPKVKERLRQMRKGLIRGSVYNGDKGRPLPPEGRHFLIVMFAMFGLTGLVRWHLDKRRRARKGRRKL